MLKSATKDKEVVAEFKKYLEELPGKLGGKSIVFIIDELDRCKPPFALEIVEVVKHLFSVPNITFVLVMNRSQLEACVRNEYGAVDASQYLQKFINLWVSLPKNQAFGHYDVKTYLSFCMARIGMKAENSNKQGWVEMFEELIIHYNVSLREVERCLSNFALIRKIYDKDFSMPYRWMSAYLSIIKVIYPDEYKRLATSNIEYSELTKATNLTTLQHNWSFPDRPAETHQLTWLLRYCLSNEEQAQSLLSEGNPFGPIASHHMRTAIKDVCRWLGIYIQDQLVFVTC